MCNALPCSRKIERARDRLAPAHPATLDLTSLTFLNTSDRETSGTHQRKHSQLDPSSQPCCCALCADLHPPGQLIVSPRPPPQECLLIPARPTPPPPPPLVLPRVLVCTLLIPTNNIGMLLYPVRDWR